VKVLALLGRPAAFLVDDTRETVPQFWKFLGFTERAAGLPIREGQMDRGGAHASRI
jgi:hypothetical protein